MQPLKFIADKTYLSISGKTFPIKDTLKNLNAVWNPEKGCWLLPVHIDSSSLRKNLLEKAHAAIMAADPPAPDPKALVLWALEKQARDGSYHWICCENCRVINWSKQHTTCSCEKGYDFRVRGMLYTGD